MRLLGNCKYDAFAVELLEPGRFDGDLVRSDGKEVGAVRAAVVRHYGADEAGIGLRDLHAGLRNYATGGIGDCSEHRGCAELRVAGCTESCLPNQDQEELPSAG